MPLVPLPVETWALLMDIGPSFVVVEILPGEPPEATFADISVQELRKGRYPPNCQDLLLGRVRTAGRFVSFLRLREHVLLAREVRLQDDGRSVEFADGIGGDFHGAGLELLRETASPTGGWRLRDGTRGIKGHDQGRSPARTSESSTR